MNEAFFPNSPDGPLQVLEMPGFGISWAGANPFYDGFCFGSESGHLAFTDRTGGRPDFLQQASASGEAVNGVAYYQKWLAVSTRKEINLIGPWQNGETAPTSAQQGRGIGGERALLGAVVIPGGAQDIAVASRSGYFVVAHGPNGVMFIKPGAEEKDHVITSRAESLDMNFCRTLALPGEGDTDLIVCAGRRAGVGYANFKAGVSRQILNSVKFTGLDVVDVCSIGTPDRPLAIAAAANDGSLAFFNDIVADKKPKTMKFNRVQGTIYRILCTGGDIFLLTSKGLFGLFGLAARVLSDATMRHVATEILRIPLQAADANMVDKRWLLAIGVDEVFKFDTEKMPKSPEEDRPAREGQAVAANPNGHVVLEEPENLNGTPRWEESSFDQRFESMAIAE